ncbi:fumarylacetoacetase [Novosphingobium piscinae]|uniref:fumarylacetoacetase n=1 Tax=Novosphingobium piscinae TaxID=1507448 RepID=A0A7X1FV50_9SPHN|nr:fumarylacetoacetase [Novosphingobium piscinae]MBC2667551.1 fumarylacetoacetase [Novosphingobium piscinae]
MALDHTHDPAAASWVASAAGHPAFPVQNLPLGVFAPAGAPPRIGTAIGDSILDLAALARHLPAWTHPALGLPMLNALVDRTPDQRRELRHAVFALLTDPAHHAAVEPHLHPAADCTLHLPFAVGDYTDFYVGIHHATNIGKLFRPDNPLLPNYKHVPIGYHGRASSVRPSGVPVVRPKGQGKPPEADAPVFGPCVRLDYELELGVWIAQGNAPGDPIPVGTAADHVAGYCLLNDWSARDLQAWEYQPLGPFLAKNFHTTVSPWVITAEAMAPFRVTQPPRPEGDPAPLPYLWDEADQARGALGVELEVLIATPAMRAAGLPPHRLSRGPASNMYWTVAQIVAHHASNGCDLRPGDLLGTGTISAPTPDGYGSLMELSTGGKTPVTLPSGETRSFLEDGDEVILAATARADGFVPIGFGECRATILPAR